MYHDCHCPITNDTFAARLQHVEWLRDTAFVWVVCPYCDIWGHTLREANYDRHHPQLHCLAVPYSPSQTTSEHFTVRAQREIRRAVRRQRATRLRTRWFRRKPQIVLHTTPRISGGSDLKIE